MASTQCGPSSGAPTTTAGAFVTSVRPLTTVAEVSGGVPVAGVNVTWNRCFNTLGRTAFLANVTSRKIRVSALEGPDDFISRLCVDDRIALGRIERLETVERHDRRRHVHDEKLVDQ